VVPLFGGEAVVLGAGTAELPGEALVVWGEAAVPLFGGEAVVRGAGTAELPGAALLFLGEAALPGVCKAGLPGLTPGCPGNGCRLPELVPGNLGIGCPGFTGNGG
jgi:hypothetical protein